MTTLTIRNLAIEIKEELRVQAASHGRSMEAEVREILTKAVARNRLSSSDLARRIHKRFAQHGGVDIAPAEREPIGDPIRFET